MRSWVGSSECPSSSPAMYRVCLGFLTYQIASLGGSSPMLSDHADGLRDRHDIGGSKVQVHVGWPRWQGIGSIPRVGAKGAQVGAPRWVSTASASDSSNGHDGW